MIIFPPHFYGFVTPVKKTFTSNIFFKEFFVHIQGFMFSGIYCQTVLYIEGIWPKNLVIMYNPKSGKIVNLSGSHVEDSI